MSEIILFLTCIKIIHIFVVLMVVKFYNYVSICGHLAEGEVLERFPFFSGILIGFLIFIFVQFDISIGKYFFKKVKHYLF